MAKVMGFGRTIALFGMDDIAPNIMTGLAAAVENCWKDQKDKCRMGDDSARLQQILGVMRMVQLVGGDAQLSEVPICGTNYLGKFEATVVATPEGATMTVSGTVKFTLDHQEGVTQYFKPSSGTVSWKISGPYAGNCTVSGSGTVTVKPTDGTLQVTHGLDENLTVTCAGSQLTIPEAGRVTWFNPPLGLITASGNGAQISGSRQDPTGNWSWNLQVQ
jgi:hypothetical protein